MPPNQHIEAIRQTNGKFKVHRVFIAKPVNIIFTKFTHLAGFVITSRQSGKKKYVEFRKQIEAAKYI